MLSAWENRHILFPKSSTLSNLNKKLIVNIVDNTNGL